MSDKSKTTAPGLSESDMLRIWREKFGSYDENETVSLSRNAVRAIAHRLHAEKQLSDAGLLMMLEAVSGKA